jgi:hypothetical protein
MIKTIQIIATLKAAAPAIPLATRASTLSEAIILSVEPFRFGS